jgi:hypothetical protein
MHVTSFPVEKKITDVLRSVLNIMYAVPKLRADQA